MSYLDLSWKAMVASEQLAEGLRDRRETMEVVKQNITESQEKVWKQKIEKGQLNGWG